MAHGDDRGSRGAGDAGERLSQAPLDASDVEVRVRDGVAVLSGTVPSRRDRQAAEDAAEAAQGVEHVQNNLRVRDNWIEGGMTPGMSGPTAATPIPPGPALAGSGPGSSSGSGTGSATNVTPGQTDGHSGSQTGNDAGNQSANPVDREPGGAPSTTKPGKL